ncbi:hypothetical protein [Prosthecomicrobium pneumaticum]|uniref:Putative nucleic acid-binding Zn-ribbon protein n=1 Tax=Prosthecomicrobium pneumaticum TaxID=81895 RepID=A0A7W9FJA2_9HYPH|nr:hypothetical protein [Prosthecomicrobium pneumaticum]MBB5751376.1 putative nucleic acid-binding Zn-ribbon protein [Prosthecomicrobium pneumaticum]
MTEPRTGPFKRGMRDVATIQSRLTHARPNNRTQAVGRYARLENERMRLQRELDNWTMRKLEAERALARIDAEIAAMRDLLLGTPDAARTPARRRRAAPKGQEALVSAPALPEPLDY